jgi:predicted Zn-dependent protease
VLVLAFWGYRASRHDAESLDVVWSRAQQDFMAGRYDQAEAALGRLSRLRKPTPLERVLWARLAMVRNRPDLALAELAQVPDDHYMGSQARLLSGQLEQSRDRARVAEEFYHAALRLDPGLIQAHRQLIYIYGMQLRRAELNAEFLALSERTELTADSVYYWSLLRNSLWEPGEANATLARFVTADPCDRWSRLALAENYRRMGLYTEAESTLSALPQGDREAIVIRAQSALDLQEQDRAERFLSLGGVDDPVLARLRGRLALSRRDARLALHHFRIAYAADPDDQAVIIGLSSALAMIGEPEAALPFRESARKLQRLNTLIQRAEAPRALRDPVLLRQLGAACGALHRDAEARAWYALAIAEDPLDSESQQALFRLRDPSRAGRASPHSPPAR